MNTEMMPFFAFLLLSEDQKKQSDRIIQELKASNDARASSDAQKVADELIAAVKKTDLNIELEKFQVKFLDKIDTLLVSINMLREKLDSIERTSSYQSSMSATQPETTATGQKSS